MTDKSKATQGRVRITYEADSITDDAGTNFRVAYVANGAVLVPVNAVVEPLEDLRNGDIYLDADDNALRYCATPGSLPWYCLTHLEWHKDSVVIRPLSLIVRGGKRVV